LILERSLDLFQDSEQLIRRCDGTLGDPYRPFNERKDADLESGSKSEKEYPGQNRSKRRFGEVLGHVDGRRTFSRWMSNSRPASSQDAQRPVENPHMQSIAG
jgi:hypothetical protein